MLILCDTRASINSSEFSHKDALLKILAEGRVRINSTSDREGRSLKLAT